MSVHLASFEGRLVVDTPFQKEFSVLTMDTTSGTASIGVLQ